MNKNNFDKNLQTKLNEKTNEALEMKDVTWNKIEQELFINQKGEMNKMKNKKRLIKSIVSVAAVGILSFGLTTDTGEAFMKGLKEMFVPEKQVEIIIEGEKENKNVELEVNEKSNYIIYVDKSKYKLINEDGKDKILPKNELGEKYPEVSMEIEQKINTSLEKELEEAKDATTEKFDVVKEEKVETPINGTVLYLTGKISKNDAGKIDSNWDTPVYVYYFVEGTKGEIFVITQKYFMEATEGHGMRFDSMLESFEIVK